MKWDSLNLHQLFYQRKLEHSHVRLPGLKLGIGSGSGSHLWVPPIPTRAAAHLPTQFCPLPLAHPNSTYQSPALLEYWWPFLLVLGLGDNHHSILPLCCKCAVKPICGIFTLWYTCNTGVLHLRIGSLVSYGHKMWLSNFVSP